MTDAEIIKALECCAGDDGCDVCPMYKPSSECITELQGKALDLINRQKAEIEKLKEASEEAVSCFHRMESLYNIKCMELKVAKAEAIKEFAERLTDKADLKVINAFDSSWVISQELIDNLVKEMVGEG